MSNGEPGCHYYEQLCYNDMWLKVGDCVFIKSHGLVRPRVGRYNFFLKWYECITVACIGVGPQLTTSGICLKTAMERAGLAIAK